MLKLVILTLAGLLLGSCSTTTTAPANGTPTTRAAVLANLAPSVKLRAAINFGNPVLAFKNQATGEA